MKHIDIISAISELWSTSSFQHNMEYIKAHQDDYEDPQTSMESLNIDMDSVEKSHYLQTISDNFLSNV